jgi:hypothetical protein
LSAAPCRPLREVCEEVFRGGARPREGQEDLRGGRLPQAVFYAQQRAGRGTKAMLEVRRGVVGALVKVRQLTPPRSGSAWRRVMEAGIHGALALHGVDRAPAASQAYPSSPGAARAWERSNEV